MAVLVILVDRDKLCRTLVKLAWHNIWILSLGPCEKYGLPVPSEKCRDKVAVEIAMSGANEELHEILDKLGIR